MNQLMEVGGSQTSRVSRVVVMRDGSFSSQNAKPFWKLLKGESCCEDVEVKCETNLAKGKVQGNSEVDIHKHWPIRQHTHLQHGRFFFPSQLLPPLSGMMELWN